MGIALQEYVPAVELIMIVLNIYIYDLAKLNGAGLKYAQK